MQIATKLPKVGTTIFTVMSQLAAEHGAVNLGQGFPDFPVPERLVDELARAMREGKNQYAPMSGIPALRQAIAGEDRCDCYGRRRGRRLGNHRHQRRAARRSSTPCWRWCARATK